MRSTNDKRLEKAIRDYKWQRITRGRLGWELMQCGMSQSAISVVIRQQDNIIAATKNNKGV